MSTSLLFRLCANQWELWVEQRVTQPHSFCNLFEQHWLLGEESVELCNTVWFRPKAWQGYNLSSEWSWEHLSNTTSLGLRTTLQSSGPKSMHDSLTRRACISLTCLTVTSVGKSAVLKVSTFSKADWTGLNGKHVRAFKTKARSQVGIVDRRGGFSHLAPCRFDH